MELVDTLALGASVARREGSSPFIRTKISRPQRGRFILVRISFEPSDPLQRVKVSPRASRTLSFHPFNLDRK